MKRDLSEFAKFVRKLRIDNDEYLSDMATKLGVTSNYLSSVEIGSKQIPKKWYDILVKVYNLNDEMKEDLKRAIIVSQPDIKIDLTKRFKQDKELIYKFVDRFDFLNDDDKNIINDIISKYQNSTILDIIK